MATAARKVDIMNKAQLAYMSWLQKTHPALYKKVVPDDAGLSGIIDSITSGFNSLVNNAGALFTTYVSGKTALDLLKVNTKRAKAGQPPFATIAEANQAASLEARYPMGQPSLLQSIPPMVWIAGGGLILFLLLRKK